MEHNVVYIGNDRCKLYVGSSRRCVVTESALPYDAEIEYLEFTGTQYIDPDYTTTSTSIITVDVQLTQTIAQSRMIGNSTGYFESYITGGLYYGFASNGGTKASSVKAGTTRMVLKIDNVSNIGYIDNTSVSISKNTSTYFGSCYLMARPKSAATFCSGKLYSASIKNNTTVVRDFIPVRVGQVGYMYDRVSGQLFGNSGTGNFTLGQDIVPIEYIQSSNTQWIDTGFKPNQDTSVYMTVLIPASNIVSRFYETRNGVFSGEYALINFGQSDNQLQTRFGNYFRGTKLRNKLDINTVYTLFMDKNSVYLDGTLIGTAPAYTFQCNYNLPLFALNNAGIVTSANDCTYRLYNCKIYDSGVLIRDYIPVRVGTTGYLLDKLTHILYSNSGTGDFILGNDKT